MDHFPPCTGRVGLRSGEISLDDALVVAVVVTGLVALFSTLRLVSSRVVRVGYWFLEPAALTSLHFLPPKDLRDVRRRLGLFEARRALKEFLTTLDAHGIQILYVESNLSLVKHMGFVRYWPASPFIWLFISIQHRVATGRWHPVLAVDLC